MPDALFELDTPVVAAHHQPAVLIDLAMARDINLDKLLRGTRLFRDQLLTQRMLITPAQFYQLIDNSCRLLPSADTPFLVGQRLLPGHYGAASDCLRHSATLLDALEALVQQRLLLTPLLAPRLLLDDHYGWLFWHETCNHQQHTAFLIEATMTAVYAMSRQLCGHKLPWEFRFSYPQPRHLEQYWLHLGQQIYFDQQVDCMRIPRQYLHQPLPQQASLTARIAQQEAQQQRNALPYQEGILERLFELLQSRLQQESPRQEQVAAELGMSTSGLKRVLQKHNTSYQQQLDHVRKATALELMLVHQCSNEDVARLLQIHDAANFRRCLKRWTGMGPSQLRALWAP